MALLVGTSGVPWGFAKCQGTQTRRKGLIKHRDEKSFTKWRKEEWPDKITWDSFLHLVGCQGSHSTKSVKICCSTCRNACYSDKDTWH